METSFAVYAHNWPAFELWAATWRQWRWVASGFGAQRVGLDWCQVEAVMRMRGIERASRSELVRTLKIMEDAALDELRIVTEAER